MLITLFVVSWVLVNQFIITTYDGLRFSFSKKEAIESNTYFDDYVPSKKQIRLRDSSILALPIAWSENSWANGHYLFFIRKKIQQRGLNFIIPDTLQYGKRRYYFQPEIKCQALGGGKEIGYVYKFDSYMDTIKIFIVQPKGETWQSEAVTDTILYYRK